MTYPRSTTISILHESVIGKFATKVYAWMAGFLGLTAGISAFSVSTGVDRWLILHPGIFMVFLGLELLLVFGFTGLRKNLNFPGALALVVAYTGLTGITLSTVFTQYHLSTLTLVFLITSGIFGLATVFGFIGRSILGFGHWFLIGLLALIAAMVGNLFIGSGPLDYLISAVGVVLFTGLAVYDTQMIKEMARQNPSNIDAIDAALGLYLDFLNLFLFILRFFRGDSKS